jgi:hypothetical protein
MITRRNVVLGATGFAVGLAVRPSSAADPRVTVTKDPNCGCCGDWVEHLRQAGFAVEVRDVPDVNRVKARLGVPSDLAACHTAEVSGYVIEGHVPASSIRRLLAEKPNAIGLAVAGMPVGSPGMEVPGTPPDTYDVVLFGAGRRVYARFRGAVEISN